MVTSDGLRNVILKSSPIVESYVDVKSKAALLDVVKETGRTAGCGYTFQRETQTGGHRFPSIVSHNAGGSFANSRSSF